MLVIRQETIEQAVLGVLFEQYLTVETLRNIRQQLVRLEATTGARHKRDIEGIGAQLKDITRQIETLIALLTEVEHRRPLLTKIDELEGQRVALAARLQATVPSGANDLKRWDDDSLRAFVERYRSEIEFGDPESKKSLVRTLVASASLDGDDLPLVPNYPGITGVKMASLRGESSNQLLETLEEWNEYLEHQRPPMPYARHRHHICASLESIQ